MKVEKVMMTDLVAAEGPVDRVRMMFVRRAGRGGVFFSRFESLYP